MRRVTNCVSRFVWTCVATTMLLGVSACSYFKENKNPPAALVDFKQTLSVKTAWSTNVGSSGDYAFSPSSKEDNIFAAAANGNIYRLDAKTGREIWKVQADLPLTAGVGVDSSTLAVVGEKGVLFGYDLDGKLRWKAQASSEVLATPVVGSGVVVVRSIDNRIAAYDSMTGKRRWVVERTLPPLTLHSAGGMVIADNHVFVGLPGGKLIAIALETGSVRWEGVVGEPRGATELERVADVSGVPVVMGTDICAAAYQGKVSCFDMRTGAIRWGQKISSDRGVSVDERYVFAVDEKGTVNAFGRNAGLNEWKNDKLAYRRLSSPISIGQAVAVADMSGYVHFLSRENGSFLARIDTGGSPVDGTPIVVGANVIFQTKVGKVVALTIN